MEEMKKINDYRDIIVLINKIEGYKITNPSLVPETAYEAEEALTNLILKEYRGLPACCEGEPYLKTLIKLDVVHPAYKISLQNV